MERSKHGMFSHAFVFLFALTLVLSSISCVSTRSESAGLRKDIYMPNLAGDAVYEAQKYTALEYFNGPGRTLNYCDDSGHTINGSIQSTGVEFGGGFYDGTLVIEINMECQDEHCIVTARVAEAFVYRNGHRINVPQSLISNKLIDSLLSPFIEGAENYSAPEEIVVEQEEEPAPEEVEQKEAAEPQENDVDLSREFSVGNLQSTNYAYPLLSGLKLRGNRQAYSEADTARFLAAEYTNYDIEADFELNEYIEVYPQLLDDYFGDRKMICFVVPHAKLEEATTFQGKEANKLFECDYTGLDESGMMCEFYISMDEPEGLYDLVFALTTDMGGKYEITDYITLLLRKPAK
ncbi:MAG: hypothetical protein IJ831_10970 [Spirochaetales bacterium]|nr:hypothetical protein [Spirochaetales bacterium]